MAFRFDSKDDTPKFGVRRSGRLKIEKRSYVWRFLALKVPFRKSDRIRVSESCSVAGTIESETPSVNI
jgi:hypothetical protein